MRLIQSLWSGDVPLGRAWWFYGALIGILLQLPLIVINEYPIPVETAPMRSLVVAYAILVVVYSIFISVAVWRSATKYAGPKWFAILAKVALICGWLQGLANIIGPSLPPSPPHRP